MPNPTSASATQSGLHFKKPLWLYVLGGGVQMVLVAVAVGAWSMFPAVAKAHPSFWLGFGAVLTICLLVAGVLAAGHVVRQTLKRRWNPIIIFPVILVTFVILGVLVAVHGNTLIDGAWLMLGMLAAVILIANGAWNIISIRIGRAKRRTRSTTRAVEASDDE